MSASAIIVRPSVVQRLSLPDMKKSLYESLSDMGLLGYGSVIPADIVRKLIGISLPITGTRAQFAELVLLEFGPVAILRDQLLDEGKYLKKDGDSYRILMPSENAERIQKYNDAAVRKLQRATRLRKHTPKEHRPKHDNAGALLLYVSQVEVDTKHLNRLS
jgi:hypothetical protein